MNPNSQYAFIVSANTRYVPELCALLNSLDYINNRHDVHVIAFGLPESFVQQFNKLSFRVIVHEHTPDDAVAAHGESEILCRKRFWYAATLGQAYDAVCVLDADMFFVRAVDHFFEIAAKTGLLIGAALEQKRVYGKEPHQEVNGKQLLERPLWNPKDVCCAPLFADMRGMWGTLFADSWTIFHECGFKAPDMEAYNLLILDRKLSDRVLMICNSQLVGTNEKLLKPYMRVIEQGQDPTPGCRLWTESGDPIYIVHGQFVKQRWRDQQILNRRHCIKGYLGGADHALQQAVGSLELLHRCFMQMLTFRIQIEAKAYTPHGEWGEQLLSFDPFQIGDVTDSAKLHAGACAPNDS